jgi:hypothetical protein
MSALPASAMAADSKADLIAMDARMTAPEGVTDGYERGRADQPAMRPRSSIRARSRVNDCSSELR